MINEAGTYSAKATDEVLIGKSRDKGTPFVGVYFKIAEGKFANQLIKWEGWLTENTAERTIESLQHCGWRGEDISELLRTVNGLTDNEVDLVVEMEKSQDGTKEYPKVRWVNRKGNKPKFNGEALDAAQAAAFGQKYRGLAMSLKAKQGSTNATKPVADDDIPF